MPVNTRELMEAIAIIANERNVQVTMKQSAKGAMVCAATAFIGGILLGPVGLAAGGTAGGLMAYKMTGGTFRPLADVLLNDLNDAQQERLVRHVNNAVAEFAISDLAMLLPLLMNNAGIQQAVLNTAISFVTNELKCQVIE
ncbi:protein C19orf12 homolog [Bactrocera neohumeralis]|uniref:protein C19orf12 homolog n=1 Tax=Bactrocera tryoni TaxID=59916 RepID=UPI001A994686|nr:protein C19orf12 homolog [Bactrocera tryoni]XP_050332205.1 protein C19orf12 homolog [Bactrocera neohumeralis]